MNKYFIGLCLLYLVVYLIAYTFHGQLISILKVDAKLEYRQTFLLQLLQGFRFFSAFYWTRISDKRHNHRAIITLSVFGYYLSFVLMANLKRIFEPRSTLFYIFIFVAQVFNITFNSAIFPSLDALTLNYLHNQDIPKSKFGSIRLFGSFGHAMTNIVGYCVGRVLKKETYNRNLGLIKICYSGVYIPFFLLVIYFLVPQFEVKKIKNDEVASKTTKRKINIFNELARIPKLFYVFCISLIAFGFLRCSLSDSLDAYMMDLGVSAANRHLLTAYRTVIEVLVYLGGGYVEKYFNIDLMFLFALICGSVRSGIYTFTNISNMDKSKQEIPFYISEIMKAFWSAFYGYSSSRIARSFCREDNQSIVSGLVYGCYNGLSYLIFYSTAYTCFSFANFNFKGSQFRGLFLIGLIFILLAIVFHSLFLTVRRKIKNKG
ncbi:hypothetical protein SLOPH_1068 [Spraguea lophii 42_110]|uniref:Major facilitator superfamily associated domain-containing protein n=1 Tax=Spraguea lophii (strain 42_110) TaxID=1358809 RepID=S7XHX5_SPRLO|nr:hypothetical protein SLOPH_1068 [Spraguea lophii 42_110]